MIWKQKVDLAAVNQLNQGTLTSLLGIVFIEIGPDFLTAIMPIKDTHKQPMGIMHGGSSCVLAETVGSIAANLCVDPEKAACVGLDLNINHIRPVRSGVLTGKAKPFHLGKTTQVWEIQIENEEKKIVAISRLTIAIIKKDTP